jgi:hypothetical protein
MAYGCARHRDRGNAVCPVTIYQSKEEVEAALVDQLQTYVLGEDALAMVIGQVRAEIEGAAPSAPPGHRGARVGAGERARRAEAARQGSRAVR